MENDEKSFFKSLIQAYETLLQKYMNKTRKNKGGMTHDQIARELYIIDKKAKNQLKSDDSNPYGIEAYENERRRLRAKAFGEGNNY
jgi:hypothetical protein